MNGLALQCAGALAIFAAIGHGYLGDKTLAAQSIEPPRMKNFIRLCYQFGSLGWLAGGILFLIAPRIAGPDIQLWIVAALVPVYASGAAVNAWFTNGRHFGWVMLAGVVLLAMVGVTA